jgi:site-specific DNA-methyltransferase (adenine-specific)
MYIPDKSVDMILCDLPYGTTACKWDTVIPFKPLWEQYKRIIKDNRAIVLTASQPFTTALGASNIEMLKYAWCWEKSNAGDCMNVKNKPMKKHEDILVFSNGTTANKSERRMLYNPQGLTPCTKKRSGCDYSTTNEHSFKAPRPSHKAYIQEFENYPIDLIYFPNDKNAVHPTQKPVALFEYLIKTYTNEGDTVLDNCIGSGTTAIACLSTKRNFIGIEKEEKYWKIAIDRIEKHKLNMIPNISFRNKEFMERQ